jgi:WD40 repeat protein
MASSLSAQQACADENKSGPKKERRPITNLAFTPDGKNILSGDHKGKIQVWDVASKKEVRHFFTYGQEARNIRVAFSPDGKLAVTGGDALSAYPLSVWDVGNGEFLRFVGETKQLTALHTIAFSPDGELVLTAGYDMFSYTDPNSQSGMALLKSGVVKIWKVKTGKLESTLLKGYDGGLIDGAGVDFSPDGKTVAVSGGKPGEWDAKVWVVATGKALRSFGKEAGAGGVAFSSDGKKLFVGGITRLPAGHVDRLQVYDVDSGKMIKSLARDSPQGLLRAPKGDLFASIVMLGATIDCPKAQLRFWKPSTYDELGSFQLSTRCVWAAAFSPDSKGLLVSDGDGVDFISASTGKVLWSLDQD